MGLKLCIVTIYNGNNYGAALQAVSLWKYLEGQGHEVVFLNNHARDLTALMQKKIQRKREIHQRRGYLFQYRKRNYFRKLRNLFPQCEAEDLSSFDVAVLGSDEIWNIKEPGENTVPWFFGKDLPVSHIISYAPSVSQSEPEDFENFDSYVEAMKKIEAVSVRDSHSEEVLKQVLPGKQIAKVSDPTLLHGREFYENMMEPCWISGKYILIYSYRLQTNPKVRKDIEEYASQHGLKTVSILEFLGWCDKSLVPSLGQMLTLFDNAEIVVTDTFHGCLLSMIFQKEFVVMSGKKNKVSDLLEEFSLTERLWNKERMMEEMMKKPVDYEKVNRIMDEKRTASEEYLRAALKSVEEECSCLGR